MHQGFIPVSPHDEFAPTSTELDRVRPQPDCGPFDVSEVLKSILTYFEMKVDQTLACSSQASDVIGSR